MCNSQGREGGVFLMRRWKKSERHKFKVSDNKEGFIRGIYMVPMRNMVSRITLSGTSVPSYMQIKLIILKRVLWG